MDYRYRFTLTHTSVSPEISQVIDEPIGWKDIKITLERSEEFFGVIELFEVPLIFYGTNGEFDGGRDFLMSIIEDHGFDEQVEILVEISTDEGVTYEELFSGLVSIGLYKVIDSTKIECPISRNDFWSKFINRMDTPVNIQSTTDLDGNEVDECQNITVRLTPQAIEQKFRGNYVSGWVVSDPGSDYNGYYFPFDVTDVELDEIDNKYNLPVFGNTVRPAWIIDPIYAGEYTFDLRVEVSRITVIPGPFYFAENMQNGGDYFVRWYFQKNEETPIQFNITDYNAGTESTGYDYSTTLDLVVGDRIYVYGEFGAALGGVEQMVIWGSDNSAVLFPTEVNIGDAPSGSSNPSYFYVTANTLFPETLCDSFFIHDVAAAIVKRIGGPNAGFYSEPLGSDVTTERQYESNGCGWNYALQKGLHLRDYTLDQKKYFSSFREWWNGVNPIFNLGLTYDIIDGEPVVNVMLKSDMVDPDPVVLFDYVNGIEERLDQSFIFKKITVGYQKWQSEEIRGLDDPQTKKTYATKMEFNGREFSIISEFIAASTAIENTRRQTITKSADYKLDNDTFIIALAPSSSSPDESPETWEPELDENFDSVTGALNDDSRYNFFLTPFRNFSRWANLLNGCLLDYQDTDYKFTSGEGNYDFSSEYDCTNGEKKDCEGTFCGDIAENDDIPVSTAVDTVDYLFTPVIWEFEHPLDWEDYKTIRDNKTKAIGVSVSASDHAICFIKRLEYDINLSKAKFVVWKR